MRATFELKVHLAFDAEAKVWYVAKSDIPGLSLEADTPGMLVQRVEACAAELIALNIGEIMQAQATRAKRRTAKVPPSYSDVRPAMAWKPIFDSPMELACA
jgi:hypothetical protein